MDKNTNKTRVPRSKVIEMVLRLNPKKELIQAKFDEGMKVTTFALEENIPAVAMRSILADLGITIKRKPAPDEEIDQIKTILRRLDAGLQHLAKELKVTLPLE